MSLFSKLFGGKVIVEDVSTGEKYEVVDFPDGGIHRVVVQDSGGRQKTVLASTVKNVPNKEKGQSTWGLDF